MNNENFNNTDNEIDLKELFLAIWSKKILITLITTSAAIFSVLYALSLPNIYTSYALLAPTSVEDSLSGKLGAYSSLAGIAGISLPAESAGKSTEAIERIKSYDFFEDEFLPSIKIENLVATKKWIESSNDIIYNDKIFDKAANKWALNTDTLDSVKPSNQEAYEIYGEILSIEENSKNGFITISLEHVSPFIAKEWLNLIILKINNHMKQLDKILAENSINYLNRTSEKTNLTQIKGAISKLLQEQIQTLMLAEASKDYVFKPISSPIAPEKKSRPTRAFICILGTLLGFMLSVLISLGLYFINKEKN
tara:strand:- start:43121 stop:44047 length:927 start_codon:yes stop_codon:yes gene_type:complete